MESEAQPPILAKIHAKGYWRIGFWPTTYETKRVRTLTECRRLIEQSTVRLRGWDYPHVEKIQSRADWIESTVEWEYGHLEYWRLYQSGQFVHHLAMPEDYEVSSMHLRGLDFLNTLYRFTEIFEFAARLATREVFSPGMQFRVELHGCQGRQLISWDPGRWISAGQQANDDVIAYEGGAPEVQLLGDATGLAIDGTVHVFERFNWVDVPVELLAEEQMKFLKRRR